MHPRTRELLDYLDAQRQVLRDAFDAVPPDRRDINPSPGCWSPANIVEHLSIVEQRVGGLFARRIDAARAEGLGPDPATDPILPTLKMERVLDRRTRVTAPESAVPTGVAAGEAWAALERGGEVIREALRSADGLDLSALSHPHPIFGPLTFYHWFGFVGAHEARHAAQIREIIEQAV